MFLPSQATWFLPLLLSLLIAMGCDSPEANPAAESATSLEAGQSAPQSDAERTKDATSDSDPNSNSELGDTVSKSQIYQPPFPDRVDLFLPPKRGQNTVALDRKEGESAVKLLGFSNVDDIRVVLSIDGFVYPVAEGESRSGIEVVSIKPPAVVLQRGRQVWQASLEN